MSTTTRETTGATPTLAGAPCPPSPVTLAHTALALGTLDGWDTAVSGVAVDDDHVYATHAHVGRVNRHDSPGPGELVVLDRRALAAGGTVEPLRLPVGWQPRSVASLVRDDYERVFVVNYGQQSYSVSVLDRRTWTLVRETVLGLVPVDVAVHPGRGRAYVSDAYHGIRVIDASTGAELEDERIVLDREIHGLAVDVRRDRLYAARVRHYGAGAPVDDLLVIDLATGALERTIPMPPGCGPRDVALDAATGQLYVATFGTASGLAGLHVLDTADLGAPLRYVPTTGGTTAVGLGGPRTTAGPGGVSGARPVYSLASNRVDVVDPVRGARVGTSTMGRRLAGVAVDTATGDVYVGDDYEGTLFRLAPLATGSPVGQHPLVAAGRLGAPTGAARPTPDGEGVLQPFEHGTVVATADDGAVAVSAAHAATWLGGTEGAAGRAGATSARDLPAVHRVGNPVADTTTQGGVTVTPFGTGIIVSTVLDGVPQDLVVSGPIWERYVEAGGVSGGFGLPTSQEVVSVTGGRIQRFERATILHRETTGAHAVPTGPLDDAWRERFGGPGGFFGYPRADQGALHDPDIGVVLVEWLELENGTLVREPVSGRVTFLLPEFWRSWQSEGGPGGPLGLPLADPVTDPHGTGTPARYVDFDRGVLVWFPADHELTVDEGRGCHVLTSLDFFLAGIKALEHDQGNPDNPPDPYVQHHVQALHGQGEPFMVWAGRLPGEDDWWQDTSQVQLDLTVPVTDVVRGDLVVGVHLRCRDDDNGPDDTLGVIDGRYAIENLWGRFEPDEHHAATGEGEFFAYYVLKARDVPTSIGTDFRSRFFWKFDNFDTARLSPETYGRTFADVEPGLQVHINPAEYLHEGWEYAFYHLAYKGVADGGNCFGMCAEAVHAYHHRSTLPQPIFRLGHRQDHWPTDHDLYGDPDPSFLEDREVMKQINITHGYQLGAPAVAWCALHILDGVIDGDASIHDGRRVFRESRESMLRGDWPVLCMIKEWKTSGHVVLPLEWHEPEGPDGPLEIWIANPSEPPLPGETDPTNDAHKLVIQPDGSWRYTDNYSSAKPRWLFWLPYSMFATQPRTPASILTSGLTSLVGLGGDADTHQVSDGSGRTLYRTAPGHEPRTPLDLQLDPDSVLPGVHRVPVLAGEDAPAGCELHVATGPHDLLVHDVVPRVPGGAYQWTMRTPGMAVVLDAPTDGSSDRLHAEHLGSSRRAMSLARPKTAPRKDVTLLVEGFPGQAAGPGRRTRQFLLTDLAVTGSQRVVARVDDGGGALHLTSHRVGTSFTLRLRGRAGTALSRPRRITVPADRTVVVRPAEWSAQGLDGGPVRVEVRETPDGPPVECYDALPEGPVES